MKKRAILIPAIAMLAVTVLALTAVTFAWFYSSQIARTQAFAVRVVGMVPLSTAFYRDYRAGGGYETVSPDAAFVDDEMMIPGERIDCRVDVTNDGDAAASVAISMTGVTYTLSVVGTETDEEAFAALAQSYVIEYAVAVVTQQAPNPDVPADGAYIKHRFLQKLDGTVPPYSAPLLPAFTLGAGETARVYYRFVLGADYAGSTLFAFQSTGVQFSGVYI